MPLSRLSAVQDVCFVNCMVFWSAGSGGYVVERGKKVGRDESRLLIASCSTR